MGKGVGLFDDVISVHSEIRNEAHHALPQIIAQFSHSVEAQRQQIVVELAVGIEQRLVITEDFEEVLVGEDRVVELVVDLEPVQKGFKSDAEPLFDISSFARQKRVGQRGKGFRMSRRGGGGGSGAVGFTLSGCG